MEIKPKAGNPNGTWDLRPSKRFVPEPSPRNGKTYPTTGMGFALNVDLWGLIISCEFADGWGLKAGPGDGFADRDLPSGGMRLMDQDEPF
jgi:hypothetical protein